MDEKPEILFNIARTHVGGGALPLRPTSIRGLPKSPREAPKKWFEGEEAGKFSCTYFKTPTLVRRDHSFSRCRDSDPFDPGILKV